jgi:pimeloyl-ACP methyl ester carboxylesterase
MGDPLPAALMGAVELHAGDAGTGTPLVLLHAFPVSSAMWSAQVAALSDRARVVTPDQRGFGGSPLGDDEPSLDHAADDLAVLLDRLGLEDVVLGGLSMGGYVAMAFLRRHPGRVRALVLADTKAGADPDAARDNRLVMADRLQRERSPQALLDDVLPGLTGATTAKERPDVVAGVHELVAQSPPAPAAWAQRAMAARPDSLQTLREVRVPALVIRGDEDGLSSPDDVDAMLDALPDGRRSVLAGSGHLSALEVPQAFSAVVADFLAEVAGQSG